MPATGKRKLAERTFKRGWVTRTARSVIAESGTDALSMRRLADAAEMSTRTIYELFGSRDQVFRAVLEEFMAAVGTRVVRDLPTDPVKRMHFVARAMGEELARNGSVLRPLMRAAAPAEGAGLLDPIGNLLRRRLTASIRQAIALRQLDAHVTPPWLADQLTRTALTVMLDWATGTVADEDLCPRLLLTLDIGLLATARGATRRELRDSITKHTATLPDPVHVRRQP